MSTVGSVPAVGMTIELSLADGVSVRADVRAQDGYAVWLSAPPVINPGRALDVSWRAGGRTRRSAGTVAASSEGNGLCLVMDETAGRNRRRPGIRRHAPRAPMTAVIVAGDGVRRLGSVVDLSFGGACIAVAAQDLIPERVTVQFLADGRTDEPAVDGLDGRVTGVQRPRTAQAPDAMLVHIAFEHVGIAAQRIAELLGPAKPENEAGR
jgi:PilZ domain